MLSKSLGTIGIELKAIYIDCFIKPYIGIFIATRNHKAWINIERLNIRIIKA